jgi:pilus assembly protein CpaB
MKAARLVVLGVAVAAGGVAALLAGREKPPPPKPEPVKVESLEVLVAKDDIGMGHTLTPQDMHWQGGWSTTANVSNFIRKKDRPDAIEKLSGTIARSPFVAGEPIREAKLVQAKGSGYMAAILPPGMRAVSTHISPETGAGGFILPGDHVDVLLTRRDRAAEKATGTEVQTSEIILKNIRVLAIDQTVQEKDGQKVVVGKTATLELTPGQSESLVLAQKLGSISLALRSITDSQASAKDEVVEDQGSRRGSVNVIRFGVSTTTATK